MHQHIHARIRPKCIRTISTPPVTYPATYPHKCIMPVYGKQIQHPTEESTIDALDKLGICEIQMTDITFLFYAHMVDPIMFTVLNKISSQQAAPTIDTNAIAYIFLD